MSEARTVDIQQIATKLMQELNNQSGIAAARSEGVGMLYERIREEIQRSQSAGNAEATKPASPAIASTSGKKSRRPRS